LLLALLAEMTTIDDLVPEQLWQATKPLLSAALLALGSGTR
jgi:hypothetical protein